MKKSLTYRLFFITSLVLLVLLGGTMIFESLFFEKFYVNKKMTTLEQKVKNFKLVYSYNYANNSSLSKSMQLFEKNNNAKIAIFSTKGEIKFLSDPNKALDSNALQILNSIFNQLSKNPEYLDSITKQGNIVSTILDSQELNTKNIVCFAPISLDNQFDNIIVVISPFQTIQEASSVIREFFIYVFIAAFIIILLLALIYSNLISKPLISLNKSALKMAKMDFSEQCTITREDEIGNLAKTLNFLSSNLGKALEELKDSNEKLKKDIERERALENMRKEFIASVSHELKTPISLIEGYAEGLKDNIAEEDSKEFYLDVILDESQKMGTLVSDMLYLSQLESGTLKLKIESFNVEELIKNTIKKFYTFTKEKNIKINYSLIEKLMVQGDSFRIEQVLTNFLSNALRHTEVNGEIKITTILGKETKYRGLPEKFKENNYIFISVENSGKGIHENEMQNIWNKFYKVDKSGNRTLGGTGLGLAIVKNILTLHHSVYGIQNTEKGIDFYFSLPIAKDYTI